MTMSASQGQRRLGLLELARRYASVVLDVLLQRWRMRHLPGLDRVGGQPRSGATIIVTGPTSGIGTETAAEFARRGCHVVLACRSPSRGEALRHKLEEVAKRAGTEDPSIEVMELDLGSLSSVSAFCDAWAKLGRPVDVLVNNAGVFAMGAPRGETSDGLELHLGTNYMACYLLTLRMLPFLQAAGEAAARDGQGREARVVMVSSKLHEVGTIDITDPQLLKSYSPTAAYGQSKLAQVMFTAELRRRIPRSWNIGCYALHPGNVMTDVVRTLPRLIQAAYKLAMRQILLTAPQGARCTLYVATGQSVAYEAQKSMGYFDSDCTATPPARRAEDQVVADWLWQFSAETVKIPTKFDLPRPQ